MSGTASGSQSSLTNTQGGHCNSGMKMKIYVCESSSDPKCPNGNSGMLHVSHFT